MIQRRVRAARGLLLPVALVACLSCASIGRLGQRMAAWVPGSGEVTLAELSGNLLDFTSSFSVRVTEAADHISLATSDTKLRRLALLWKIRMPPLAQEAASDPNPRNGYVEMLTVTVAQRQFFEDGAGKAIFGSQQATAIEAAREIEANALVLGQSFVPADKLEALHAKVEELAQEHPIRGEFLRESIYTGLEKAETGGMFEDIISIPMAPFKAIAGVESGAQAIHEFNATAAQFNEIVDSLPQRLRWQLELLSYDLQEQGGALQQSLKSLDLMAQSADRLSLVAERAPQDVQETIRTAASELEEHSATLKSLLAAYQGAIGDTGKAAAGMSGLADSLARTSEQLNQAGQAWNALVTQLNAPSPPPPPGQPPSRPFDIRDYEQTAIAVKDSAEELRQLLTEVEQVKADAAIGFADRLLIDGVILVAVIFAAMVGYRLITARGPRTR